MRLLILGLLALALIGVGAMFFTYSGLQDAHVAALVPMDELSFGVFYGSANDLIALYEGPYARSDFKPAVERIGKRVNVPGLEGVDYDEPAGYYVSTGGDERFLVPFTDLDAFTEAFDRAQENINLRQPVRVARNYASLRATRGSADRGPDNPLIVKAASYPLALVGRPKDANTVRLMAAYALAFDRVPKPPGVPLLSRLVPQLPDGVAGRIASECEDVVAGFRKPSAGDRAGLIEIEATPGEGSILARAQEKGLPAAIELSELVACFPAETVLLAAAVLDDAGWRELGLPLTVGDAAVAFGVVAKQYHARRYNLLVAVRPLDPGRVGAGGKCIPLGWFADDANGEAHNRVFDNGTEVVTRKLGKEPAWLAGLLRVQARKEPPAVFFTTAFEKGTWFAAVGSQAEANVRIALACMRGARQLSLFGLQRGQAGSWAGGIPGAKPLSGKRGMVAVAMATAEGMKAVEMPMPLVDIADIGRPSSVAVYVGATDKLRATISFGR